MITKLKTMSERTFSSNGNDTITVSVIQVLDTPELEPTIDSDEPRSAMKRYMIQLTVLATSVVFANEQDADKNADRLFKDYLQDPIALEL